MIRHTLFAIAAAFMTLTAFSGTVAVMIHDGSQGVEVA